MIQIIAENFGQNYSSQIFLFGSALYSVMTICYASANVFPAQTNFIAEMQNM